MRGFLAATAVAALLSGCLSPLPKNNNPDIPQQQELSTTPFFPQTEFHCGPAALATAMGAEGDSTSPEILSEHLFIPSLEGSLQVEIMATSRRLGYIPVRLESEIQALIDTVALGKPVLVLQNLATPGRPHWHYAVLIGYDISNNKLVLRSGTERRKEMRLRTFLRTWNWAGRWAVILLQPGEMVDTIMQRDYFRALADLEQTDQLELTETAYEGALPYWPDSEFLWAGIGSIAYRQGQLERSENALKTLLNFHPNSVTGRNNLASVLLDKGCTEQALDQISRAEKLLSQDQRFIDMVNATRQEISASISQNG
ncbi:MAG: PA2778 family cysteine peptidase, partial [bacterium]